jgi:hypothetical protein
MRRTRPAALALSALAVVLACARPAAAAGDKAECASASEEAQRLQKVGKLVDAQKQLLICTRSVCPAVVRQDCEAWLPSLEAMIPSLVVAARDEDGRDLVDVKVTLDGAPVDTSSGRSVLLDPGKHTLHVEAAGKIPADQPVVVHEGERARPVIITLLAKDRPVKPPPPPTPPPQVVMVPAPPPPPQVSPFVWVLGTLATVSLASFVVFEVKASTDASHLKSTCAPRCPQSDVDSVSTSGAVANVSLALAGAFAGGALAVWLLGRPTSASTPAAGFVVGPGRVGLGGRF